jgi:general secretion pathway protein G
MPAPRPNELYTPPNPLAIWAFILGLAGFFLSIVVVGGLLGLIAVILGISAARRAGKQTFAITGIVTGALAIPAALVALTVWIAVLNGHAQFASSSRRAATIAAISNTRNAVSSFEIDNGRFPTTEEGLNALLLAPPGLPTWQGPYLDKFPADAWGRPLIYRFPGDDDPTGYDLNSAGSDGVEGDDDDIQKNTQD